MPIVFRISGNFLGTLFYDVAPTLVRWCLQQELNPHLLFRRQKVYPLAYASIIIFLRILLSFSSGFFKPITILSERTLGIKTVRSVSKRTHATMFYINYILVIHRHKPPFLNFLILVETVGLEPTLLRPKLHRKLVAVLITIMIVSLSVLPLH